MKKVIDNEKYDIFEIKNDRNDIIEIILIENATIVNKINEKEYFNGTFLKITNRKGNVRILDLISHIDITNALKDLKIKYSKNTQEKPIFCGC